MKVLLSAILSVVTLTVTADEYIDPQTNVVYTYEPGQPTASVKAGFEEVIDMGYGYEFDVVYHPGSPDAAGDIVILDRFTIGTEEYVVTSIGESAFRENGNIKSISIPETVTEIGPSAFSFCGNLAIVQLPKTLTRIASNLFQGCSQLVSVNIPSSVLNIENWAFYGCSSLSSITLPSGLITIGRNVFSGTPWYNSLYDDAPTGPFYIGPLLLGYKGDKPTGELVIKEGTTCIGFEAFHNCDGLNSVTFPESVVYVDQDAFEDCTGLKAVHITDLAAWCGIKFHYEVHSSSNPLNYAHHLYLNGEEVTDLVIPEGVTSIGDYAFDNCTALTSVTIPDGVTSIGAYAFRRCEGLISVTIPPSLTTIHSSAFIWCFNLDAVHISDLAAWCCITYLSDGVNPLHYGAHLYLNGEKVTDLVIPEGVTSINKYVFQNYSHLTSVTIPDGVISIGAYAFQYCNSLKDFYSCAEKVPEAESSAFGNTNLKQVTLHVPATSISAYQATEPWKNFKEIVALSNNSNTQDYFPEGTKWTEIRLDTLKYDSWYSKVGDEWVPNFETIEYYVQGDCPDRDWIYKKVYTNGPEWTDSLTLMIQEAHDSVLVSVLVHDYDGKSYVLWPGEAYQFDWSIGKGLYYENILMQNTTSISPHQYNYGIVDEIKEGNFGGVRPLKYVDLNGSRIIQGIGITEWNDGECLFGPPNPYSALQQYESYHWESYPERHYRSMLVHFERNGEVLYDVWPEKGVTYRPFVEDGKVWKCGSTAGISDGIVKMVEYYYFDGDTIIDGKTCKQMMCQRYVSPNHPDYAAMAQIPSLRYIGAWYEEDKKVYIYNAINQLKMTYDFSLEANDTLFIGNQSYVIGPKQTGGLEGFKGVYRDILWCFGGDPYYNYNTTWLEGVGGIDGPTVNVYYGEEGHGLFLMSCTVGDEVIYLNDRYEDGATPESMGARKNRFDFTHTIKTKPKARKRSEEEPLLYGEYNDLKLGINLNPLDDAYQVRITDDSGKVVYEKAINAGNIVGLNIDISAYAKGRYTVTVENSEESFTGEFYAQTTGIVEVINKTKEVKSNIYNLQGQRLNSLQKGLNIVNGQKIFVK